MAYLGGVCLQRNMPKPHTCEVQLSIVGSRTHRPPLSTEVLRFLSSSSLHRLLFPAATSHCIARATPIKHAAACKRRLSHHPPLPRPCTQLLPTGTHIRVNRMETGEANWARRPRRSMSPNPLVCTHAPTIYIFAQRERKNICCPKYILRKNRKQEK